MTAAVLPSSRTRAPTHVTTTYAPGRLCSRATGSLTPDQRLLRPVDTAGPAACATEDDGRGPGGDPAGAPPVVAAAGTAPDAR